MIKAGDSVKFKPEWSDPSDENVEFIALEDEDGGRVLVGALGVLHNFTPCQRVSVDMLRVSP